MAECLFCKIVEGKIPAHKVAESTNFLAFLDIQPVRDGHTLIIPKKHATNLLDFPEYMGNELVEFAQRVGNAVIASTGASGFNLGLNNGEAAGQTVFHMHVHLIPRKEAAELPVWEHKKTPDEELRKMREQIVRGFVG